MNNPDVKKKEYAKPLVMQKKYYPQKESEQDRRGRKASAHMNPMEFLEKYLICTTGSSDKFVHVRKMLLGTPQNTIPLASIPYVEKYLEVMDPWRRENEEKFLLRVPVGQERRCLNDDECEGTMIPGAAHKVILREAYSYKDLDTFMRTQAWPSKRRPCRMCARKAIGSDYFNFRGNRESVKAEGMIHDHYNFINTEGEYAAQDVIMSSSVTHHGMFAPVVIHCRLYYRQHVDSSGVVYYDQFGYARPGSDCDVVFRMPSVPGAPQGGEDTPWGARGGSSSGGGDADRDQGFRVPSVPGTTAQRTKRGTAGRRSQNTPE
jgi:hypothetical protein